MMSCNITTPSENLIQQLQEAETCHIKGALQEAARLYRLILKQHPWLAHTAYNLGIVLNELQLYNDAEVAFRHALHLQPDFPEAALNLCFALQEQGHFASSIHGYQCLLSNPLTTTQARFNLACLQLLTGDLAGGWDGYELRFESLQPTARRHSNKPGWSGSILPGTRLLIHSEQGYGDTIQMVRYLPILADYGIEVYLETTVPLVSLLSNLNGIKGCFVRDTPLPEVDCQVPIMSLPGLMGTTLENIPASVPYLEAEEDRVLFWKNRLSDTQHLRVGLAWAGRLDLPVNRKRSISPEFLESLLDIPHVLFVNLQQSVPDDFSTNDPRIINYQEYLHDFHDTAALIANLDLVITIDTSVAHLAGAMGVPTWLLLPFVPDWRWLLEMDTSPWYPSMRLFRQSVVGDWSAVVKRIRLELEQRLNPVVFCYRPDIDFIPPQKLGARLIPLLADINGGLADGVCGSVTTDHAQADLLLFPYYLEHLTEYDSIAGMRSFVTNLPYFKGHEDKHVFLSEHDSIARYHTGSLWCRASVNATSHDELSLAVAYQTENLAPYLHFSPDSIRYHTSFVGYLGARRERVTLLNGISKEKRLVANFDTVDSFHGHQPEEVKRQRRILYLESMASSITVLCPEGTGANSIRFFETLSMGRIPVLVSNALLPYEDRIDYDRFIVRIDHHLQGEAGNILYAWLERHTSEEIMECCRLARATWEQWFSQTAMGRQLSGALIRKRLKAEHSRKPVASLSALPCLENSLGEFLDNLEQNDLPAAKFSLNAALNQNPCSPVLHNMCGLLALRSGEIEAAEQAFLDALQYDHRYYDAYLELGILYRQTGRNEDAVARFFEASLVRPDCPEPLIAAIPLLSVMGRNQEAMYCCKKAQQLGGNSSQLTLIEQQILNSSLLQEKQHV